MTSRDTLWARAFYQIAPILWHKLAHLNPLFSPLFAHFPMVATAVGRRMYIVNCFIPNTCVLNAHKKSRPKTA